MAEPGTGRGCSVLGDDRPWWHRAACNGVDPALFHPNRGGTPEPALKVCRRCPVQAACLENALTEEAQESGGPTGVRGALAAKDRAPLVRARKKAVKRESPTLQRIRRLAAAGVGCQGIAREVGMKPGSVSAICRRHNIAVRITGSGRRRKLVQPVGGGSR